MSGLDHGLEPEGGARRFEVITGALGRRRWTADDRARIIEETLAPGAVVSVVARRHGLTPQQVFTWRRQARERAVGAGPAFVPAVLVPAPVAAAHVASKPKVGRASRAKARRRVAVIAVDVAGVTVTIENGASARTIAAVIGALKGAS